MLSLAASFAVAAIFGTVHGLVHDPQHKPIVGAQVTISSANSQWAQTATTNDVGTFQFNAVPIGDYEIEVTAAGFAGSRQRVTVTSGNILDLHIPMNVAAANTTVEVQAEAQTVDTQSSTSQTMLSGSDIGRTPGAQQANSLSLITDYVPGATMVHDQLHVRGGHQVTWLLDGVPVPNTNIASNVGPQFDPKDIEVIEVQRGGMSAAYGDRTYGAFNVVTRSGFERNREGEIIASYGNHHATDDQINFGSHTDRFAYFGSISGNRSDVGLEPPAATPIHDQAAGLSAFGSLIYNRSANDQLRLVTAVRGDHYQVPNTPEQQADGIRDVDDERDAFANFSWIHVAGPGLLLTVSPFYHHNSAKYAGGPNDTPVIPTDERTSDYAGGVATFGIARGAHNAQFGFESYGEHEDFLLALQQAGGGFRQQQALWGNHVAAFAQDQVRLGRYFTVNGGLRVSHFGGGLTETVADPRIGGALLIPRLNWVARAFYGRYYQPPPLLSVGGPVLELAVNNGFGFLPLKGERDEQHEFGLAIPWHGWSLDLADFTTRARNFFDHDALGNSNIFFPLTIADARIRGYEASLRSPQIARRAQLHLAFSRQWVQGFGGVSGG
ncbi:MAG TPA: TonB-dependent receptor, partial [Terriglobales bacterium]|nr:TonB-dependent receptor [Terriglobales bacterium]